VRTSLYAILCIVIRLGAVMLAVNVLCSVPLEWFTLHASNMKPGYDGMLFGFGGTALVLAVLLWIYPGMLARLAAGRANERIFETPLSAAELQEIALFIVGICFVMSGIVDLSVAATRLVVDTSFNGVSFALMASAEGARLMGPIVKIVAGATLTLRAPGLIGWVRAMRERGLPPAVRADESQS
jgi:hypothetical protein